jgi:hypothetical protein
VPYITEINTNATGASAFPDLISSSEDGDTYYISGEINAIGYTSSQVWNKNNITIDGDVSGTGTRAVIKNLKVPLLSAVGANFTFKNLVLQYVSITNAINSEYLNMGAFLRQQPNDTGTLRFINCEVSGTVKGRSNIGGFVGKCGNAVFENCVNKAAIEESEDEGMIDGGEDYDPYAEWEYIGGIAGSFGGEMRDCINNGQIYCQKTNK